MMNSREQSVSGFSMRSHKILALLGLMVVISGCHDRNPTVQQPYSPTSPSTSPTSTTPRQPAPTQSILTPAKPGVALPAPSPSKSTSD
jgi:hypothetical protein